MKKKQKIDDKIKNHSSPFIKKASPLKVIQQMF